jgi:hypothetical protein
MMRSITELQDSALSLMKKSMALSPVALKYPFPVRPARMLGLIKFDGEVYCSEKFNRAVLMQIQFPVFMKVYSTFLAPKIEYDLPVFICEAVKMGNKRIFIVDAHKGGAGGEKQYDDFFDRLLEIRGRYPELMKYQKIAAQGIQSVNSKAVCQVKIPSELDEQAISIFSEYLSAYLELIKTAEPLTGSALEKIKSSFDEYLKTVVDHDPGVKGNIIFFGRKQGIERALDIFYGV